MTDTTPTIRRLGSWRPELPDHRDRVFRVSRKPLADVVPSLGRGGRIHDQGYIGSCTGHAGTSAIEIVMGFDGDAQQLSRLMAYYLAREYIGETGRDGGAYIRDVFKGMLKTGVAPETNWRYVPAKFAAKPTKQAYAKAEAMRQQVAAAGVVYEAVHGLDGLLAALNDGFPVVFGFMAFHSIYGLDAKNNVLPLPTAADIPIGGHAVVADGYSIPDRMVYVQNSWGTKWGARGYFRMPFEWFSDPRRLADDLWTVRKTAPVA